VTDVAGDREGGELALLDLDRQFVEEAAIELGRVREPFPGAERKQDLHERVFVGLPRLWSPSRGMEMLEIVLDEPFNRRRRRGFNHPEI